MAWAFLKSEKNCIDDDKKISDFINPMTVRNYYKMIESHLLPEQRDAFERWSVSMGTKNNNNRRKLNYLFSVSPTSPFHDRYDVTYESIMKVFDENIVGYEEMRETIRDSILIAETWLEERFGLTTEEGYHLHFLPASIKKSGPSAGAAIAVAMLSALTNTTVGNIAITGEFDGDNILPVGGLKNKLRAAKTAGIKTVYIPAACKTTVQTEKIEEMIDINIVYVNTMDELVKKLFPALLKEDVNQKRQHRKVS